MKRLLVPGFPEETSLTWEIIANLVCWQNLNKLIKEESIKMKKLLLTFCAVMLLVGAAAFNPAQASFVIYDDPDLYPGQPYTQLQPWIGNGPIPFNGGNVFQDDLGRRWQTSRIAVTTGPNLVIDIFTNNRPGGYVATINWGVSDIAINNGAGKANYDAATVAAFPGAQSLYELGINMQAYATAPIGNGNGAAILQAVDTWSTSFSESSGVGTHYGGAYKKNTQPFGTQISPVEARIVSGRDVAQGIMTWTQQDNDINNNIPDWFIQISFVGNPLNADNFGLLWSTANCGNDVVNTPIPGSVLLMGTGILGLVGVGIRRKL
jgi:hypothetical protein